MKKNIVTLILIFCLLAGAVGAFAVAGGEDDPLISLSYVKTWANDLVSSAADRAKKDLSDFGGTAIASSKTYPVSYTAPYLMIGGSSMSLSEGCSVTLLSGSAKISVTAGTLVNTTTGRTVSGGDMTPEQLYVVCENSAATISVPDTCTLLAGGPVTTLGNVTFSDVGSHEWFYSYVMRGVGLGLIHGVTETSFAPDKTLTVAETITLAAQLHRLNAVGNTEIPSTAAIWYDNYRNYCLQQGIIDETYAGYTDAQMNTPRHPQRVRTHLLPCHAGRRLHRPQRHSGRRHPRFEIIGPLRRRNLCLLPGGHPLRIHRFSGQRGARVRPRHQYPPQ